MDKEKVGKFLAELRREKNILQNELSEIFFLSPQAVSKWEKGESIPDIETIQKLAEYYEISMEEILSGERKEKLKMDKFPEYLKKWKNSDNLKQVLYIFGYFILSLLIYGFAFSKMEFSGYFGSEYINVSFYRIIFSSNYKLGNFIALLAFLSLLGLLGIAVALMVGSDYKVRGLLKLRNLLTIIIFLVHLFLLFTGMATLIGNMLYIILTLSFIILDFKIKAETKEN